MKVVVILGDILPSLYLEIVAADRFNNSPILYVVSLLSIISSLRRSENISLVTLYLLAIKLPSFQK